MVENVKTFKEYYSLSKQGSLFYSIKGNEIINETFYFNLTEKVYSRDILFTTPYDTFSTIYAGDVEYDEGTKTAKCTQIWYFKYSDRVDDTISRTESIKFTIDLSSNSFKIGEQEFFKSR